MKRAVGTRCVHTSNVPLMHSNFQIQATYDLVNL